MKKNRIKYIDVARGLGIFLVIIGHMDTNEFIRNSIYSFHMPFFFFLSGYLNKNTNNFKALFLKKIRTLIIPYFFFGLLSIAIMLILKILTNNVIEEKHFEDSLRLFYYNGNPIPMNKVIWFLFVLFWVEIFNYLLKKVNLVVKIIVSCGLGYLVSYYIGVNEFRLPLGLDILPMALCFFCIGIASKTILTKYSDRLKFRPIFLITSTVLLLINFLFSIQMDMMKLFYGNALLLFLCFSLGTVSLLSLSTLIKKNGVIEFYGRNSLIVLGTHLILIRLLNVSFGLFNISITWYLQFIFVLIILYPLIFFINRYLPFFVGLKRYK